jgi:hypothetical protein
MAATGTFQSLTWLYQMVQGPPGPTGPAGPAFGVTGPAGPTGAQGVTGPSAPGPLSPWKTGQATSVATTATTSSSVIGAFASVHSIPGCSGESCGVGEVIVSVEDSGVCLGAQKVGFSWQSVGGGCIVANPVALYGLASEGVATVQADGSGGIQVRTSPVSNSTRTWNCLLTVTGKNFT